MKTIVKQVRISPKKVSIIADLVRGKNVEDADALLKYLPKKAAGVLRKALLSAAANAEHNFGQDRRKLTITRLLVTKGPTYKRAIPVSRGRSHPILKRSSHITLELGGQTKVAPKKQS